MELNACLHHVTIFSKNFFLNIYKKLVSLLARRLLVVLANVKIIAALTVLSKEKNIFQSTNQFFAAIGHPLKKIVELVRMAI